MTDLAEALISRFTAWANTRGDIRGALLIGSQARTDVPADEWSDVDLLVLTTDVPALLRSGDWVAAMGPVVLTFLESTIATGITERRALYETGLEADYAILPADILANLANDSDQQSQTLRALVASILGRGFRIVLDKDSRLQGLAAIAATPAPPALPDAARFANEVRDFWFHAHWTARKLRRGEVMMAKSCCDGGMKGNLLTVARWHVAAANGADTWHQVRFFEQWADPRLVRDLATCFAHYEPADIARALRATMQTFDWLAPETAERLKFEYPDDAVRWVKARVDETLGVAAS